MTVEDYATISAFSGVHQFCRVGQHAFIGGYSVVTKDALPFAKTVGNRARIYGLNTIGLDAPQVLEGLDQPSCAARSATCCTRTPAGRWRRSSATRRCGCDEVQYLVDFIRSSSRGVGLRRPSRRLEEVMEE